MAWQNTHQNAILVDADLQFGDVMVHLNIRPKTTISDLIDIDEIDPDLLSQILITHDNGLKLLLAPLKPEAAELISTDLLTSILEQTKTLGEVMVIDTATQLNNQTLATLDVADYILVIVTPELPSVKSAKLFLELIEALDFSMDRISVVINRANIEGGIPPKQIKDVLKLQKMFYIPYDPNLQITINRGLSIYKQDNHAELAKAINTIAETTWQKLMAQNEANE